jgi:nucleoside-diphosphate-sugar epimerase
MKIFVIGATGQVGSKVSRHLKAIGHDVLGFARNTAGVTKLDAWGIEAVRGDIARIDELIGRAQAADVTIFSPQLTLAEEQATVTALLDGLAGTGKTFLFTSGTGVVGVRTGGAFDENSWIEDDPDTPYSRMLMPRVETERLVRASAQRGVRGIVLRPPTIWGDGYYSVAERMIASYEKTGAICYVGAGMNGYSIVHIDDLCDLYARAIERGVAGALYHSVGGDMPNRAIAELLAQRFGCGTRSVSIDEAIDIWGKFSALGVMAVSSRTRSPRARTELGWEPSRFDVVDEIMHGDLNAG